MIRRRVILGALAALAFVVLPASGAAAAGTVYIVNEGSGTVSQFASGSGGLSPLSPSTVSTGSLPFAIVASPDGKSVYVANAGDSSVSEYTLDPSTGLLTPKSPASVPADSDPNGIAISPNGKNLYVPNYGSNSISQYSIDPTTGVLTPLSPATVPAGTNPLVVAVSPDGKSLYASNFRGSTISEYDVNSSTGSLSPKSTPSITTGAAPEGIAISSDSRHVYVATAGTNWISQFTANSTTGVLSTAGSVPGGSEPTRLVLAPGGASLYAANAGDNTVSQFSVDPTTGALSPKTPAAAPAGNEPSDIAITPDGSTAYVVNDLGNNVSQYAVDSGTGDLVALAPATVGAGTTPLGIVTVAPSGPPKDSTSASVSCSPGTVSVGQASTCTVTVTDTASGSPSVPTGSVSFSSDGAGTFSGSPCTLGAGSGASASCQVSYTPSAVGSGTHTITASYGGDGTHAVSSGSKAVSVSGDSTSTGVSCTPGSVQVGQASSCVVTVTDTASGSPTVPTGKVSFASNGSGSFGGSPCTLGSPTGASSTCQVSYTPSSVGTGSHKITASYGGDATHYASSGNQSVSVSQPAVQGVYVANQWSGNVSQFTSGGGGLSALSPASVSAGSEPLGITVSPDGGSVYAANLGGSISQYTVDPTTGALTPKSPGTASANGEAYGVVVSPDDKHAYVADYTDNAVEQYTVDQSTGALTPMSHAIVAAGTSPFAIAISPDGASVYVTNSRDATVSEFSVDPSTGALSPKSPSSVSVVSAPEGIVVSPDGTSVYVTNAGAGVSQFNVNASTGVLSPKSPATVPAGSEPLGIAESPDGSSVYVANGNSSSVSQFSVDPTTGDLLAKSPATMPAGSSPSDVAVTPDDSSVFVTNNGSNSISQFSVDSRTGDLVQMSTASVSAGNGPYGIAIRVLPSPVHRTKMSVSCSPTGVVINHALTCSASVQDVAGIGKTTPTGTVAFASDSPGSFSGSPCTLSGAGATATCQVSYTPTAAGSGTHTLTASYVGDSTHNPNASTTAVTVLAQPDPTTATITCVPSIIGLTQNTGCTATVTDTASGTQITPTGQVSVASDGQGSFTGNPCTLSGSGASASCQVTYTPLAVGSGTHKITGSYAGDVVHGSSSGSQGITVQTQPVAAYVDTTNGIHLGLEFDYSLGANASQVSGKVDYIYGGYQFPSSGPQPQVPNIDGYMPFDTDPYLQSSSFHNIGYWQAAHPDWVTYLCDQSTPSYYSQTYDNVPLDFTNPAVQAWQVQQAAALFAQGATGVVFDNFTFANFLDACGTFQNGAWTSLGWPIGWQNNAKLINDMTNWLKNVSSAVRTQHPTKTVAIDYTNNLPVNGLSLLQSIAPYIDLVNDEGGFTAYGNGNLTDAAWEQEAEAMEYLSAHNKAFMLNAIVSASDAASVTHTQMNWAVANYLMVKGPHSFMMVYPVGGYGTFYDRPEYHIAIGSPTSARYQSQGVQMRNYSGGLVIVNPSSSGTYSVSLSQQYVDMYGQTYTSVTLPPATGIVLLNPGGMQSNIRHAAARSGVRAAVPHAQPAHPRRRVNGTSPTAYGTSPTACSSDVNGHAGARGGRVADAAHKRRCGPRAPVRHSRTHARHR